MKGFASIVPRNADVAAVGEAIVKIVDAPVRQRPFRVHVDPTQEGAEVVNMVATGFVRSCCVGSVCRTFSPSQLV